MAYFIDAAFWPRPMVRQFGFDIAFGGNGSKANEWPVRVRCPSAYAKSSTGLKSTSSERSRPRSIVAASRQAGEASSFGPIGPGVPLQRRP
jgi:hypothetical protein